MEENSFLFYLLVVIGPVPQVVKLPACSGVPMTTLWGCFYFLSFIVVEVTYRLGKNQKSKPARDDALNAQEE